jgi:hypothetical protein
MTRLSLYQRRCLRGPADVRRWLPSGESDGRSNTEGSLDHPAAIAPTIHYWDSKRLRWVQFSDQLPKYPEFPPIDEAGGSVAGTCIVRPYQQCRVIDSVLG